MGNSNRTVDPFAAKVTSDNYVTTLNVTHNGKAWTSVLIISVENAKEIVNVLQKWIKEKEQEKI